MFFLVFQPSVSSKLSVSSANRDGPKLTTKRKESKSSYNISSIFFLPPPALVLKP